MPCIGLRGAPQGRGEEVRQREISGLRSADIRGLHHLPDLAHRSEDDPQALPQGLTHSAVDVRVFRGTPNGWSVPDRHQAEVAQLGVRLRNGARGLASGEVVLFLLITGREIPFAIPLLHELEEAVWGFACFFLPALQTGVENLEVPVQTRRGLFSQKNTQLVNKE